MSKPPRRTPAQIAQDALDLTLRKLERNKASQENLRRLLAETQARGEALERLAAHQRTHPALADHA